jgi:Arc/MetJ-type ribon-helix-helix transcriptional regulator
MADTQKTGPAVWDSLRGKLEELGVEMHVISNCLDGTDQIRVVGLAAGLKEAVESLGRSPRDTVVMVRVDEDTATKLDAWVESGAVKSRSEAAALFIREGLNVRASELEKLDDALREVRDAKARLRERAEQVFGGNGDG